MIKVDFHIHSEYSHDAMGTIPEILRYAKYRQLDAIAITDHDTVEGSIQARKMRTQNDVQIIPGLELTVPGGEYGIHLIALYTESKHKYDNIVEAITEIKKQGGVVVLPHPFRTGTGLFHHLSKGLITDNQVKFVLENVDYVEALNLKDSNEMITQTLQFVKELKCPMVAGSDAHLPAEIGTVYCEIGSLGSFKAGTERTIVVAHTRCESTLTVNSLGSCLAGHENFGRPSSKLQSKIRSTGGKIINTLPSSRMRTSFKKGFQKMLTGRTRNRVEEFMKSSRRVRISKDNNSHQIILAKMTKKETSA